MAVSQGILFSEPSIAETGVWCELSPGIDPAHWAGVCRFIGSLSPEAFHRVKKKVFPHPDSLSCRFKRIFSFEEWQVSGVPPVCLGPEGLQMQDRQDQRSP